MVMFFFSAQKSWKLLLLQNSQKYMDWSKVWGKQFFTPNVKVRRRNAIGKAMDRKTRKLDPLEKQWQSCSVAQTEEEVLVTGFFSLLLNRVQSLDWIPDSLESVTTNLGCPAWHHQSSQLKALRPLSHSQRAHNTCFQPHLCTPLFLQITSLNCPEFPYSHSFIS